MRIADIPMYYRMPAAGLRPDLLTRYPQGTTTLDLIKEGLRTSTTRRPFAQAGDVITFKGYADPFEVVSVARPDLQSVAGRQAWEQAEGWNLRYIDADPKLRGQVYNPNAVQTLFRPTGRQEQAPQGGVWAFGGSRITPPEIQDLIARIAVKHGGPVVHGGAPGADRAATRLITDPSLTSIYLNGPSDMRGVDPVVTGGRVFNAREMPGWQEALKIAAQFEDPYRPGGRTYNARNVMVLLGPQLETPRERLVVWTPGGMEVGGTGHAIRVANHYGIPVRNLGSPSVLQGARRYLGIES